MRISSIHHKAVFFAAIFLAGAAAPLQAAQRVGLQGGLTIPTRANDLSEAHQAGPAFGAHYLRELNNRVSLGGQFNYLMLPYRQHRVTTSLGGDVYARSTADAQTFEALGRINLLPEDRVEPYLQLGLGLTRFHQRTEGEPARGNWFGSSTAETRVISRDTSTNFAASFSAGAETLLGKKLVLGLQATWQMMGVAQDKFGSQVLNLPVVMMTAGWKF